jgi:3-phenylpropionate/trans-cinnamate dioxygenase ferredoxin reductase subunit
MMADLGMVIVGAGEAGARAAVELRTEGWSGPITLIGKEKLAPYERPPLSKSSLIDEDEPSPMTILDEAKQSQYNIQLITDSSVVKIDREQHATELSNGQIVNVKLKGLLK